MIGAIVLNQCRKSCQLTLWHFRTPYLL